MRFYRALTSHSFCACVSSLQLSCSSYKLPSRIIMPARACHRQPRSHFSGLRKCREVLRRSGVEAILCWKQRWGTAIRIANFMPLPAYRSNSLRRKSIALNTKQNPTETASYARLHFIQRSLLKTLIKCKREEKKCAFG